MAVAFVTRGGLELIRPSTLSSLEAGAHVEFVVGMDLWITEPQALRELYELCERMQNAAVYCYHSLTPRAVYHPKLYLCKAGDDATCIVGSSNLTKGGLQENVEANVVLRANAREEVVSDAYETYAWLKFKPERFAPDPDFLDMYAALWRKQREAEDTSASDPAHRQLMKLFRDKAASLPRPTPTPRDVTGWLELVYDALPEGRFTNEDVYAKEGEFQRHYPENQNIRAKIRQQLQLLRDMGFIEHLGPSRWRRV